MMKAFLGLLVSTLLAVSANAASEATINLSGTIETECTISANDVPTDVGTNLLDGSLINISLAVACNTAADLKGTATNGAFKHSTDTESKVDYMIVANGTDITPVANTAVLLDTVTPADTTKAIAVKPGAATNLKAGTYSETLTLSLVGQ